MNAATLNSNQFNISEAIFSDFEMLNQSVFKNKSITPRPINFKNKIIFASVLVLVFFAAFGIHAFYELFKHVYLNPIYHPANYGAFIVVLGWFAFNSGIFLYRLQKYLKYKPIVDFGDVLLPLKAIIFSFIINNKKVFNAFIIVLSWFSSHGKKFIYKLHEGLKYKLKVEFSNVILSVRATIISVFNNTKQVYIIFINALDKFLFNGIAYLQNT